MNKTKFILLGTGTSQGVPVIACNCPVCRSADQRDKRLRCSLLIESEDANVVIDIGPDFRQQMLLQGVTHLDAVVLTHEHMDHLAGLDEIRAFNFVGGKPVKVYATEQVQKRVREQYSYIFMNPDYPGIPKIELVTISEKAFIIGDIHLQPIRLMHGQMPVTAFRVGDFTYITDANYIPPDEKIKIIGTKHLVINALRREKHHSHFNLQEAIELGKELSTYRTYLIHISHQMGKHEDVSKLLPENVILGYDGLKIES